MKAQITAERLRELLDYVPETGLFYWRQQRGSAAVGRLAGIQGPSGYRLIRIDKRRHFAHRLAWLYVHGRHPTCEIDHVNGNPTDDRIANLRQCSRFENNRNVRAHNATGFKGVYREEGCRRTRWYARISRNYMRCRIGPFASPEEAAAAYDAAARLLHGKFARTNAPLSANPEIPQGLSGLPN